MRNPPGRPETAHSVRCCRSLPASADPAPRGRERYPVEWMDNEASIHRHVRSLSAHAPVRSGAMATWASLRGLHVRFPGRRALKLSPSHQRSPEATSGAAYRSQGRMGAGRISPIGQPPATSSRPDASMRAATDAATCYLLPVLVRPVVRNPACPQSARPPAGIIHVDFRRKQLPEIRSTTIR